MLVLRRPLEPGQYCSNEYQAELRGHGIVISMSGKGNCFDNAMVETFFKTLNEERVGLAHRVPDTCRGHSCASSGLW